MGCVTAPIDSKPYITEPPHNIKLGIVTQRTQRHNRESVDWLIADDHRAI